MNWAHIHLLLNHLPVIGTIFGVLRLLFAWLRKSEELKRVSLGVFVLTALLALPVYFTGEPAEKVVERLPVVAEPLIERHENAALFALLTAGGAGIVECGMVLLKIGESGYFKLPEWKPAGNRGKKVRAGVNEDLIRRPGADRGVSELLIVEALRSLAA